MAKKPSFNVEKFISEQYLSVMGKNLPAMMKAVNGELAETETLIQNIVDQFFAVSASGRNLIKLGEGGGFVMPDNSGLDITSYTELVPIMVSDPKQIRMTAEALVEAFYGIIRTRPNILSGGAGPYNLNHLDNLIVETSQGSVNVSILENQVSDINNVSAQELVSVLNVNQDLFYAEVSNNRNNTLDYIRIYSKVRGYGSYIKITGGTLQNILQFPYYIGSVGQTTWNITKDSEYNDEIRLTWDGNGTNPDVWKAKAGDFVTIRGLEDGLEDFSLLNGSYTLVDAGYDYFIIRNTRFKALSSVLVVDDNISFTSNRDVTMFDLDEKATVSEIDTQTVTISVPAVPPLVRRHLSGSMHLEGYRYRVTDFTRNVLTVSVGSDQIVANGINKFVVDNQVIKPDFKSFFKTTSVDSDTNEPSYTLSPDFGVFPFTSPQNVEGATVSNEFISMNIGSDEAILKFAFPHGLEYGYGFTLQGFSGSSNISAGDINKEHIVYEKIDSHSVKIKMTKKYEGLSFSDFSVYRRSAPHFDGSDFYLEFPSPADLAASGLKKDSVFSIDVSSTVSDPFYASRLLYKNFTVLAVNGTTVSFYAGYGPGSNGQIFSSASGVRSASFGNGEYFFDKNSNHNKPIVESMFVSFVENTDKDGLLGSFIYDPDGRKTTVTVSGQTVNTKETLLEGEAKRFVQIEDGEFPESGELVVAYGTDKFEGPIRFYAVNVSPNRTEIMIDPAYRFKNTHESGTTLFYIHARQPYDPRMFGEDYPAYLTGTSNGRNTMFVLIQTLLAHGFFVERNIELPDLRYEDPAISPFS